MVLPIARIREYDRNPRRERNPKYDEIKASIRAKKGLENPLTITRRSGEEDRDYMIHAGGNTRLRILKELYQETQDPVFFNVQCLFIPWESESGTLTAHLIENDTRGELTFIDRSRAIRELRMLLEEESGDSISLRQLSSELRERGYAIDPSVISRMDYAMDTLLPAIPMALRAGLGKHQIERIRHLETQITQYLKSRNQPEKRIEEVRLWFIQCLARHDGVEWDLRLVKRSVMGHLAELCDEDPTRVRLDLEALLNGANPNHQSPDSPALVGDPAPARTTQTSNIVKLATEDHPANPPGSTTARDQDDNPLDEPSSNDNDLCLVDDAKVSNESFIERGGSETKPVSSQQPSEKRQDDTDRPSTTLNLDAVPDKNPPSDLKSLRSRMWTLATQLAQRNGMGECILSIRGGCGFIVDLPESPLYVDGEHPTKDEFKRVALWWFLTAMSEQWIGGHSAHDILEQVLPEDARLFPVVQAQNSGDEQQAQTLLITYVSEPSPIEVITRHLLPRLGDGEFKALVTMIDTRRQFETVCTVQGKNNFWEL